MFCVCREFSLDLAVSYANRNFTSASELIRNLADNCSGDSRLVDMNITKNQQKESRIGPLDNWIIGHDRANLETEQNDYHTEHYEMPRRLNWNLFRKIYDIQPFFNYGSIATPSREKSLSIILCW
jgi:hypothetical protein